MRNRWMVGLVAISMIPHAAVPKCWSSNYRTRSRKTSAGDLAPNLKLVEASIGLDMALKGRTELPRTVRETNAHDDKVPYSVVIFRNTARTDPTYRTDRTYTPSTFPDIAREAEQVFSRWHAKGATAEQALLACGTRAVR